MRLLLLVVSSLFITVTSLAKSLSDQKTTYVYDYAHVLSKKQIDILNYRLKSFENRTSAQLQVVLVKTVSDEYDFEDDAVFASNRSQAGAGNNGMLYVIAIESFVQKLEMPKSLRNAISASEARLITESVKPEIEHVHYSGAIYKLAERIEKVIADAGSNSPVGKDIIKTNEKPDIVITSLESKKNYITAITALCLYVIYLIIVYLYQKKYPSPLTITHRGARNIINLIQALTRK